MDCLDKFNRKMAIKGGSLRQERIVNSQNLLSYTFDDDPSFTLGVYIWELGVKSYFDRDTIKIRFYDRKFSSANGVQIKFQTLIDTKISVGDILYNSLEDEYLICTESFLIDGVHWQGKVSLCNWILKWQKKSTGEILEYPCYTINSTQYNSGETSNRQFTIGSSQHMITLPCDENTVILSSPQRFYLDKNKENPTTFITTQNDTTSYNFGEKGLVKVTVTECPNNNLTDRLDLGVCDYFEPDSIKTDNSVSNDTDIDVDIQNQIINQAVIYYDSNVIKSGGDNQIFTGKFFDNDGNEIDIPVHWNIVCDFKDCLEIEQFDNWISIKVDDDSLIDEDFKLVLSDESGKYTSSLIIKIVYLWW